MKQQLQLSQKLNCETIKVLKLKKQETELSDDELQEAIDHSLGHLAEMVVKEDVLLKMATQLTSTLVVQLTEKNSKVDKLKVTI